MKFMPYSVTLEKMSPAMVIQQLEARGYQAQKLDENGAYEIGLTQANNRFLIHQVLMSQDGGMLLLSINSRPNPMLGMLQALTLMATGAAFLYGIVKLEWEPLIAGGLGLLFSYFFFWAGFKLSFLRFRDMLQCLKPNR